MIESCCDGVMLPEVAAKPDGTHKRFMCRDFFHLLPGVVGAAVVYEYNFKVTGDAFYSHFNTADQFIQHFFGPVNGANNGEMWLGWGRELQLNKSRQDGEKKWIQDSDASVRTLRVSDFRLHQF